MLNTNTSGWMLVGLLGMLLPMFSHAALIPQPASWAPGFPPAVAMNDEGSGTAEVEGFKPGSYTALILFTTQECRDIEIGQLEADAEEILGRWKHPSGRGRIRILLESQQIKAQWSGYPVLSTSEVIQTSGKSVFITSTIKHAFGRCEISVELPDVLN